MSKLFVPLILYGLLATAQVAAQPAPAAAPPGIPADQLLARLSAFATKTGFTGELAAQVGTARAFMEPGMPPQMQAYRWRWASVTKQVIAVLVMQEVSKRRIALDEPVSRYIPGFKSPNASKISVRQLLRHQSGLPNPDDIAASSIDASAYYFTLYKGNRDPLSGYCAGKPKGEPGGKWEYNNCDYMVAGALLKAVTGKSWQTLVEERIAKPLKLTSLKAFPSKEATVSGKIGNAKEPRYDLATFGAAAGLYGKSADLLEFDSALRNGVLLPKAQLDEMWDGQPDLGYIALGQWVFSASLKGCATPVKIVERRGAIGGVQVRNFILPALDASLVAFSNNGNFEFGEIWQGSGFSHDLLAAVACP